MKTRKLAPGDKNIIGARVTQARKRMGIKMEAPKYKLLFPSKYDILMTGR